MFIVRNCCVDIYGGVGFYIYDFIKFKLFDEFLDFDFELFWVWFRLRRLFRGFFCLVVGIVYYL